MFLVGSDLVALVSQLIVCGISGEQVDVCEVRRVTFSQMGYELAQTGEVRCIRLIGQKIAIERWVRAHPGDQSIQFRSLRRVFEAGRRDQTIVKLPPQSVSLA